MSKETDRCECNILHEKVVERALKEQPSDEVLEKISDFFKMFSDKTRIRILSLLSKEEMCVCDIAHTLEMTQSSISHQLRVLRNGRVVKNRRDGKVVYYSLDDEHVKDILRQGILHQQH